MNFAALRRNPISPCVPRSAWYKSLRQETGKGVFKPLPDTRLLYCSLLLTNSIIFTIVKFYAPVILGTGATYCKIRLAFSKRYCLPTNTHITFTYHYFFCFPLAIENHGIFSKFHGCVRESEAAIRLFYLSASKGIWQNGICCIYSSRVTARKWKIDLLLHLNTAMALE